LKRAALIDGFLLALFIAEALAKVLPCRGYGAELFLPLAGLALRGATLSSGPRIARAAALANLRRITI